jgi:hypothetical protein
VGHHQHAALHTRKQWSQEFITTQLFSTIFWPEIVSCEQLSSLFGPTIIHTEEFRTQIFDAC